MLRTGSGVTRTEIALAGRMDGVRRLGGGRYAVSGFAVADYLHTDD